MARRLATCTLVVPPLALVPRAVRGQREYHDQWNSWYVINADICVSGPLSLVYSRSASR